MREINSNKSLRHTKFCRMQRSGKSMTRVAKRPLKRVVAAEVASPAQWTCSICSSVAVLVAGKLFRYAFSSSFDFCLSFEIEKLKKNIQKRNGVSQKCWGKFPIPIDSNCVLNPTLDDVNAAEKIWSINWVLH